MSHHDLPPRPEMGGYILREVHNGRAEGVLVAYDASQEAMIAKTAGFLAVQGYACRLVRITDASLFAEQPQAYREEVLPKALPALSPESSETPTELAQRMLTLLLGR